MVTNPRLVKKIKTFLAANEQHSIQVELMSDESRQRNWQVSTAHTVEVHLNCRNGCDWMGFTATGKNVESTLAKLFTKWEALPKGYRINR